MGPIILGVSAPVWHRNYGGLFDFCVDYSLIQGDVKDVCEDSAVPEHPAWHVVWVYRFTWVYSGSTGARQSTWSSVVGTDFHGHMLSFRPCIKVIRHAREVIVIVIGLWCELVVS